MGHNNSFASFKVDLAIILGALASLSPLAIGLKGQTSFGGIDLISRHQSVEEFSAGKPVILEPVIRNSLGEGVSSRKRKDDVRVALRGIRLQLLLSDPMSGMVVSSGFWVSSEGLAVTCWRNVSSNPDGIIVIKSAGTSRELKGKLVAQDVHKNLALIRVSPNPFIEATDKSSAPNSRLKVAIPAPKLPQVGDRLIVPAKPPKQPDFTAETQPVSEVRPVKELGSEMKILLSRVKLFGSSGEPVVDGSGQVVGILEGPYPSLDREKWGSTEVVIPVQAISELVKNASLRPPSRR